MAATIISNFPPFSFGQQTNQAIAKLVGLNSQLLRLGEAIATASSGYTGADGTEFEAGNSDNLFGVQPVAEAPGQQGQAYRYAMGQLVSAWNTFWTEAKPYVEQLDNGGVSM